MTTFNAHLRSTQGVDIDFDYTITYGTDTQGFHWWHASNIRFVLNGPGVLHASSNVTVVLINRGFSEGYYFNGQKVYQVPLIAGPSQHSMRSFFGTLGGPLSTRYVPGDFYIDYYPQIAVVVDRDWQVDPIQSGIQHNFNFAWQM